MITFNQLMALLLLFVALVLAAVFLGGWLVFKSKSAPGEGLIRTPKGQVFTIPDVEGGAAFPDGPSEAEKGIQQRSMEFLNRLMGGDKQ